MTKLAYPFAQAPAEGEAIEVAQGVLWMRLPLPMALDHVNVYALDDGDGWTIIDTGFASKRSRSIWRALMDGPLTGKPIRRIIVTHHHPDHVGLAGWFQAEFGAELICTRTTWLFSRMLQLDAQDRPTEQTVDFWHRAGMASDILEQRCNERPFNYADCVAPMPLGYTRIQQGGSIIMGGRSWDIHIGNGHSPEHATFWSRDDNLVISGDQIIASISSNIGVYATEPEADPVADWLEACERLSALARDDHFVLGGHKLPFTGLPVRMRQLIENHHGALRRLEVHLSEPQTAAQCFMPLFKRQIVGGEYGLALVEALSHCLHLWHHGRATRSLSEDGQWLFQRVIDIA